MGVYPLQISLCTARDKNAMRPRRILHSALDSLTRSAEITADASFVWPAEIS